MSFDAEGFLKNVSTQAGVYRMYDAQQKLIYVGKAKNLKKRLSSYFQRSENTLKTQALVAKIAQIDVTITASEVEALLLESNLIKQHRPRYNILFKDDKTYPYVYISGHDYPRIKAYRGATPKQGQLFGPYPNMSAVRETMHVLHKVFLLRQCEDSVFAHRSRPCLQYQIKRCSAPCVGHISQEDYQRDVDHVRAFLKGKSPEILSQLKTAMQQASDDMQFEQAAHLRDQISALQQLQAQQSMQIQQAVDADVLAHARWSGHDVVVVLYVRGGRVLGSKPFFPKVRDTPEVTDLVTAFMSQQYVNSSVVPAELIVPCAPEASLVAAMQAQHPHCQIKTQVRSTRAKWQAMALMNAEQAVQSHVAAQQKVSERLAALQQALDLPELPKRIECFDISHTMGEATVASCVVFDEKGIAKQQYRRFNIENIQAGDDYAAMRQVLLRRYQRQVKENQTLPDIVLIDGGKGQLNQAQAVMAELDLPYILLVGVAKGPTRKSGMEQLWVPNKSLPIDLPVNHAARHVIQHIRDEAHRFAIAGHRAKRQKQRGQGTLTDLPGVGSKRRQAILHHFGSWDAARQASVSEIAKVPGISATLAKQIMACLETY